MGAGMMSGIKERALLKTDLSDFNTFSMPRATPGVEIVTLQTQRDANWAVATRMLLSTKWTR